jgi:hypothetical protein
MDLGVRPGILVAFPAAFAAAGGTALATDFHSEMLPDWSAFANEACRKKFTQGCVTIPHFD